MDEFYWVEKTPKIISIFKIYFLKILYESDLVVYQTKSTINNDKELQNECRNY